MKGSAVRSSSEGGRTEKYPSTNRCISSAESIDAVYDLSFQETLHRNHQVSNGLVEATIRGWTDVRTRRAAISKVSNKLHNGFGMGRAVPSRIHAEHNASVPQSVTKEDAL